MARPSDAELGWLSRENRATIAAIPDWVLRNRAGEIPAVESLAATNPYLGYPTGIGRTTRRAHITGTAAPNIPHGRLVPGGDWHMTSTWFGSAPWWLQPGNYSTGDRDVSRLIGTWGVVDGRSGLRRVEHPAGRRRTPVWTAAYDRAVIEMIWEDFQNPDRWGKPTHTKWRDGSARRCTGSA